METVERQGINISTPEAVTFTIEAAGLGARFVAAAIDTILLGSLLSVVSFILIIVYAILAAFQGGDGFAGQFFDTARYLVIAVLSLAVFVIIWGYYIFFEHARNGVTPGKRAAGIRVVKADGSPLTFSDVAIRNLIRVVDFMPSGYLIGMVSIAVSRKNQRLGDLAAGTVVVHVREASYIGRRDQYGRPVLPGRCRAPLEPEEFEAAMGFLLRRLEFNPWRRAYLAARIASAISLRYNLPLERFPDNESFLLWLFSGADE